LATTNNFCKYGSAKNLGLASGWQQQYYLMFGNVAMWFFCDWLAVGSIS
jgi:hypothetical protein